MRPSYSFLQFGPVALAARLDPLWNFPKPAGPVHGPLQHSSTHPVSLLPLDAGPPPPLAGATTPRAAVLLGPPLPHWTERCSASSSFPLPHLAPPPLPLHGDRSPPRRPSPVPSRADIRQPPPPPLPEHLAH
jgi:hypothetical protein